MKCDLHPFYPRKYCWGCEYKQKICDVCGKTKTIQTKKMQSEKELVQLNVCENCLLLLEKKGKMQSFDGEFLIRVDTDKTGRRVFTIKDRYNE